jgi:hypothetical protein
MAAGMPSGKQDRQAQAMLGLVEIRAGIGPCGTVSRPVRQAEQGTRELRDTVEQRARRRLYDGMSGSR